MPPKNRRARKDTFVSTAPPSETPPEAPAETKLDLQAAQVSLPVEPEPEYVGSVPEGMGTTYSPADPPPPAVEAYTIPEEGRPGDYMILRVSNRGWVIEEKWQHRVSFEALQDTLDSEIAAGHSGTLYRNNAVVFSWGEHAPPRL